MTTEQKVFLQSIGRYSESMTEQQVNEIITAFSGGLAGYMYQNRIPNVYSSTSVKPSIQYKKMSLFDAPKNSVLVHACNAKGVWGSGIAKEFKSLFPNAFEEYNKYCNTNLPYHTVGTALVTKPENSYKIGCLITSSDFGARLNAEQLILNHTKHALDNLVENSNESVYYSNKFNSGYFKVPWEKTEKLIDDFVKKYNKVWVICNPDLKETK